MASFWLRLTFAGPPLPRIVGRRRHFDYGTASSAADGRLASDRGKAGKMVGSSGDWMGDCLDEGTEEL